MYRARRRRPGQEPRSIITLRRNDMTTTAEFVSLEEQFGAHNYHPLDVVISRAEGAWVWDVEGRKYLDFLAAYSAVNQGHCHPRLLNAMVEQIGRVGLTSRAFRNDQLGPFCKELTDLTGFDRVLPMNTGAEAVETAIKAARKWAYTVKGVAADEAEILVFEWTSRGTSTAERRRSSGFPPRRITARASARSPQVSEYCPMATATRWRRRSTRTWPRFWSSRSRVRPASSSLLTAT
jgi:4-aminobutyrate aminotransferase-like enzyme